jgi:hypothetical protein
MSENNQFFLPNYNDLPPRVLSPHIEPDHYDYYVKMACTEGPFRMFQRQIGPLSALSRRGHLIVARGSEGVGKSALLYRCARWLEIAAGEDRDVRIDVTRLRENDFDDRGELGHALRISMSLSVLAEQKLPNGVADGIAEKFKWLRKRDDDERLHMTDLLDAHDFLSAALNGDNKRVFAVILPSSLSLDEVKLYVRLANPGIIFFAELDTSARDGTGALESHNDTKIVELFIDDHLSKADALIFVRERENRAHRRSVKFPRISEKTLDKLIEHMDGNITIHLLQNIFSHATETALAKKADEVSYDDLIDFLYGGTESS